MGIFGGRKKTGSDEPKPMVAQELEGVAPEGVAPGAGGAGPAGDDPAEAQRNGLFKQPAPLSPSRHAELKVDFQRKDFSFAAEITMAPLGLAEVGPASLCYPIIFSESTRLPYAVMGLLGRRNLFIDAQGRFERGAYAPAHLRRYPFVLINTPSGDKDALCVDMAAPQVGAANGSPLFENGAASGPTKQALAFLEELKHQEGLARLAVGRLIDDGLSEVKTLRLPSPAETKKEDKPSISFLGLSADKLNGLSAETLGELAKAGALGVAYAQINALHNWSRLLRRAAG